MRPFGTERDLHRVGENVDAAQHTIAGIDGEFDVFGSHSSQRDEGGRLEAVVPYFDDMTQRTAIEGLWQQCEEFAEVGFVEFLVRRELPEQGAEFGPQFGDTGIQKPLD